MDRQRKERIVDDVLNRALGPQLVEPRQGLEGRILANLATMPPRRPWWRWMWVPALAAAALLAIAIGIRMMQHEAPKPIEAQKTVEAPKQEVARTPQMRPAINPEARPVIAHRSRPRTKNAQEIVIAKAGPETNAPRLDTFPSRGALTPEEKLLLAFVRQQPSNARALALEQAARSEQVQKYLDKGEVPVSLPSGIVTK